MQQCLLSSFVIFVEIKFFDVEMIRFIAKGYITENYLALNVKLIRYCKTEFIPTKTE